MAAIAKLIRHTPGDDLKAYFTSRSDEFRGSAVAWAGPKNVILKQVLGVVDRLDEVTRNRLALEAERIDGMTSEVGQSAILSVVDLRLRCIDCYGGCLKSVRCCTATDCPSWPFRMGQSPWRAPASEERRQLGRELAARRPRGAKNQRQGSGFAETEKGSATTLPDAIDGEKYPLNLVGEKEGA